MFKKLMNSLNDRVQASTLDTKISGVAHKAGQFAKDVTTFGPAAVGVVVSSYSNAVHEHKKRMLTKKARTLHPLNPNNDEAVLAAVTLDKMRKAEADHDQ